MIDEKAAGMPGVEAALAVYNAVWDAAPGITAENVAIVRHEAMTAALAPLAQENERLEAERDDAVARYAGAVADASRLRAKVDEQRAAIGRYMNDDVYTRAARAEARATEAEARVAQAVEALRPFAWPPLYVFDKDMAFVPTKMPDDWEGGGYFTTEDFRRARTAAAAIRGGEK